MPIIRPYYQQTAAEGGINTKTATAVPVNNPGASLAPIANSLAGAAEFLIKQKEDQEVSDVSKRLAQARTDLTNRWIDVRKTAKPGDLTTASNFSKEVTDYFTKFKDTVTTRAASQLLNNSATDIQSQFAIKAHEFQVQQAGIKAKLDYTDLMDSNSRTLLVDPTQFDDILASSKRDLDEGKGLLGNMDVVDRQALYKHVEQNYARAAVSSRVNSDPVGFLRSIKKDAVINQHGVPASGSFSGGGFDSALTFILRVEGGYKASDGISKAPVNFGINQAANPDINVAELTKEQLPALYRDRYWNQIDGDSLPPKTALIAMDAAVNMGVSAAKRLLDITGGDPVQMMAERRKMYENIIKSNPAQAENKKGWDNRLTELQKEVDAIDQVPMSESMAREGEPIENPGIPGFDKLNFEDQLAMIRQAENRANQVMSAGRAQLTQRLKDAEVEATSTGQVTNPPSKSELEGAYGVEQGGRLYKELQGSIQLGRDLQAVRGMSVADQEALIKSYTPTGGEGFAFNAERQRSLINAVRIAAKQLEDDPVKYTYAAIPEVKNAMDAMLRSNGDPVLTRAYVNAVTSQQKRLGVARPKLLTEEQAEFIVSGFNSQADGQNSAQLIKGLQRQWGESFQDIYQQVAKKLPAAALVMPLMSDENASLLASASKLSHKELYSSLESGAERDISEALVDRLSDFSTTISTNPNGPKVYELYRSQMASLAAMYMRNGDSVSDASSKAYEAIIGKNYNFTDTYRIPKMYGGKSIDPSVIEAGANAYQEKIGDMNLDLPVSGVLGISKEDIRKQYVSTLQKFGKWVTTPGEHGLTLYYGSAAIKDVNGEPIRATWEELSTAAKNKKANQIKQVVDLGANTSIENLGE